MQVRPSARRIRRHEGAAAGAAAGGGDAATTTAVPPLNQVLERLFARESLSFEEAGGTLRALLASGADADAASLSAFLVLLRAKGETGDEVAGLASAMLDEMVHVDVGSDLRVVDIVGTGGDGIGSVNISTGATLLTAACGCPVAKHGNRSVSSMCGSADVLEAMQVAVDLSPTSVAKTIRECGIGFMFAPRYHPAMAQVVPVRKAIKVRTAFNLLGPMLNPAGTTHALIGTYNEDVMPLMAAALQKLGHQKSIVVHSMGLDEVSPLGPARFMEVTPESIETYTFDPLDYGFKRCTVDDLKGGDRFVNADMLKECLGGKQCAASDALVLNAGVALAACDFAAGVEEGLEMAREVQKQGKGLKVLEEWSALSTALAEEEQEKVT